MSRPAAIDATFVKIQDIASRKVARLHFEIPIERANEALAALGGFPDPANPAWVAIARLQQTQSSQDKWKPEVINPAVSCALTCRQEPFWRFLAESKQIRCEGEDDAATYVRRFCRVNTRADLATNPDALQRWNLLLSAFEAWRPEALTGVEQAA